jgi:LysM repeat protein
MSKKTYAIILVILIAGLLLTACERSASVSPMTTATANGEIPFPVATQSQIMKDILAATQTAAALKGTMSTGNLPGFATSTPAFTYSTPTPLGASQSALTTPGLATATASILATATPTAISYPTPTPGIPSQYTIQSGEFPYCIARRFNVNPADLLSANGLSNTSQVSIGTVLTIPQGTSWPGTRSLKAHPTTYTVGYGDTIGSIACGFGDADPNTILAANGLSAGVTLTSGQVLQIP